MVITTRALVPAPLEALAPFLAAPGNQALLLQPLARRLEDVEVAEAARSARIAIGIALPSCARARLRWDLEPLRAATGVELALEVHCPLWPMRAFLRLGGRRWFARSLGKALDALREVARLADA